MPRKKNVIAPEAQTMDLVAQKKDENLSAANQILSSLGILGGEYERFLFVEAGKNLKGIVEKGALGLGAVLLAINEHEQHGSFLKALEEIDINYRKAYRYIHVAKRYAKEFDKLSNLTVSKFNILDELTDIELEKLIDGEEVKGLTLDAIDALPSTEARKRLREAEEKARTLSKKLDEKVISLEAIIKQKSSKITDLEYEIRHGDQLTKEKKAEKALQKYRDPIIDSIHEATERIKRATAVIDEAQKIPHVPFDALEKLIEPWKGSFGAFLEAAEDFSDAFTNIHVDKGRG